MKQRYKRIIGAFLMAACLVAGAFWMLRPTPVRAEALAAGPLSTSFTEQGSLTPERSALVGAPLTGTVGEVLVREGSAVSAGEALLDLDASVVREELAGQLASLRLQQSALRSQDRIQQEQLQLQLESAKLQYQQQFGEDRGSAKAAEDLAGSSYLTAREAYEEAKDLYEGRRPQDSGVISSSQLFVLEQQMIAARKSFIIAQNNATPETEAYYKALVDSYSAQLGLLGDYGAQQLQITIDILEKKLARLSPAAPYDGVVWEVLVGEGEFVAENQPVARVYSPGGMEVEVLLLAEDALALREGDPALCRYADGSEAAARVLFVSPVARKVVSSIGLGESRCAVRLLPESAPAGAGAGHQVDVTFTSTLAEEVLSAPAGSLVPHQGGSAVYLVRGGRAVLAPVEAGRRAGGRVEILSGLALGDRVVLDPYGAEVKDGARVTVEGP